MRSKKRKSSRRPQGPIKKPEVSASVKKEVNKSTKTSTILDSIRRWGLKAYSLVVALIGLTGYTVANLLPDLAIDLKNPSDKNSLVFEVTNKSWIPVKHLKTLLIVDTLQTTHIENIGGLMASMMGGDYKMLSHNQTYTFEYNPSMFYGPDPNYSLFSARVALAVKYTFLNINMEDYIFYDGQYDFSGSFLWRKMPERSFAKEIESDTTSKFDTNRFPFYKNFERNTRGSKKVVPPPLPAIDSGQ